MIPLTLYIHTPWCVRKCPYCDFNSHAVRETIPEQVYLEALLDDFDSQSASIQNRTLSSIFIGGGTPSLMSAEFYRQLLNELRIRIAFEDVIEITLEANPGTVEQQRFRGFREAGINRLSLGIQSFNDKNLKNLGRIHDSNDATNAINVVKQSGFDNFNCDLMFGLPNQTLEDALKDLNKAITANAPHISWYQLTLEPNTYFHRYPPKLPDDEKIWEMQSQGLRLLQQHGYEHYEVSAYGKSNRHCKHNINYWEFGDYIGIGAGAHGKITDLKSGEISRQWNMKHPNDYLDKTKKYRANSTPIEGRAIGFEFMLNALRLKKPIPIQLFEQRTLSPFTTVEESMHEAIKKELVSLDKNHITPTKLGRRFLNDLLELFL